MKGNKYKYKENLCQMTDDIINLNDKSLSNAKKLLELSNYPENSSFCNHFSFYSHVSSFNFLNRIDENKDANNKIIINHKIIKI